MCRTHGWNRLASNERGGVRLLELHFELVATDETITAKELLQSTHKFQCGYWRKAANFGTIEKVSFFTMTMQNCMLQQKLRVKIWPHPPAPTVFSGFSFVPVSTEQFEQQKIWLSTLSQINFAFSESGGVCWNCKGIIHFELLATDETITAKELLQPTHKFQCDYWRKASNFDTIEKVSFSTMTLYMMMKILISIELSDTDVWCTCEIFLKVFWSINCWWPIEFYLQNSACISIC